MRRLRVGVVQLAAIFASMLLAGGLVLRISTALSPVAPETRDDVAAERAIQLRDGANGVPLFVGEQLAPNHWTDGCVQVRATGTRVPDQVVLTAVTDLDPLLAEWLKLDVYRGRGRELGRSCFGFEQTELVATGTAARVLGVLATEGIPWEPADAEQIAGGHATSYRFVATMLDGAPNEVMGRQVSFDLVWVTEFDSAGRTLLERTVAVLVRFSQDSLIPMFVILAAAVMFLGVQDRIDMATPRLAQAALRDELVVFEGEDPVDPDAPDAPD